MKIKGFRVDFKYLSLSMMEAIVIVKNCTFVKKKERLKISSGTPKSPGANKKTKQLWWVAGKF